MSVPHPKGRAVVWTCVKDHIINENEDYKNIRLCGFYYKLFEGEKVGGSREGLDGYPYLKHRIQLWPVHWLSQMKKIHEAVCMKKRVATNEGGKRLVHPFKRQEFCKCIGCNILEVNYGKKVHKIWSEVPKSFGKYEIINCEEILMETPIYIGFIVLTTVVFTSMLAI